MKKVLALAFTLASLCSSVAIAQEWKLAPAQLQTVGPLLSVQPTHGQVAEKLGTKKSNISRQESVSSDVSPRLSTLQDYARMLGYQIKVEFEPTRQ